MSKKYLVKYNGNSVEMSKPNSTMLVYKIPYSEIKKKKTGFIIPNQFIVYILYGRNDNGKDMIYVGKSKNGIENRPTAHKDKFDNWTTCFILTQFKERSFFNDGTIQYLENELNSRVEEVQIYTNTTKATTPGTANDDDQDDCDEYLDEAYKMLQILGLDLLTNSEEYEAMNDIENAVSDVENRKLIPNGIYTLSRKIKRQNNATFNGKMKVEDGKFILLTGSEIVPDTTPGLLPSIEELRNNTLIENGILQEDVIMDSPSACGEFVIGGSCNGWKNWKNSKNEPINIYRKQS